MQLYCIYSFDHDGLGRYGDPINPSGDLVAMDTVRHVVKEGGLLFLTVPIGTKHTSEHIIMHDNIIMLVPCVCAGPDVVVWNLHRRYGALRLPLLLRGWEQVEAIGWEEDLLYSPAPFTLQYEPVLVLMSLP